MSDPNDPSVFTAERIVSKREYKGKTQYLIKWKGFSNRENTWEPIENILDPGLLTSFEKSKQRKPNRRSSTRNSTLTESGSQQNGNGVTPAQEPDQVSSSTSVPADGEDEMVERMEAVVEKKPTRESLAQVDTETDTEPDTEPDLEIVIQPDSDSSITEQSEVANNNNSRPVATKSELKQNEIKAETNSTNHHQEAEVETEPELVLQKVEEVKELKDLPILNSSPTKLRTPTPTVARTSTPVARTNTPLVSAPAAAAASTIPTVTTNGIHVLPPLIVPVTAPLPAAASTSSSAPPPVVKASTPKPTPSPSMKATATKSTPTCRPKSEPHSTPKSVGQSTPKQSAQVTTSTPKSVAHSTPKSAAVQTPPVVSSSIVPVRGEKRAHTLQSSKNQAGEPQAKQKRFVVMNTVITDVTVNNQTITISESRTGHGFFKESGKNGVDATTQAR